MRSWVAIAIASATIAAAASCDGGVGGDGGSSSTTTGTGAGTSVGGGGSGGAPECVVPTDCGEDSTCRSYVCETGLCGIGDAPLGTACDSDGGEICDGHGSCVAASCRDGVKDGDETDVDCGGSCGPCAIGGECVFPDDCLSQTCDAGTCIGCPNDVPCELLGAFYCAADGTCQPRLVQGEDCPVANACLSGFCADGKCCDAACDAPCDRCDQPAGTCTTSAAGTAEPSCAPYLCDGAVTSCPTSCGGDGDCVAGGYCEVSTGVCIAAQKPVGEACTFANQCQSGFCVDGFCCAVAGCVGGCNSCGVPGLEGQCAPRQVGTECRAAVGGCDIAETCDGIATTCPADAIAPSGATCRPSVGGCDPAELCDGVSTACPTDAIEPAGTVCRAVAGLCDVAELCDGMNGQCPFDAFVSPGTVCRMAAGECDLTETCSGLSATCPSDVVVAMGTACGAGVAEPVCNPDTCDGMGSCQDAPLAPGGTPCTSDAAFCSGPEICQTGVCTSGGDPCSLPAACDETNDACVEVWINELHYDNVSTDQAEGVEVAGTAGTDLSSWSIVLYNGSSGAPYATIALGGTIPDQQVGLGTAFFAQPGIQNGAPDGLALVSATGVVVQFLSYEGTFVAASGPAQGLASVDLGVQEEATSPLGLSLQLSGTGSSYADFAWVGPVADSPGSVNAGQTFQ